MAQFDIFNLTKHVEDDEMRFTLLIEFMNNLYSNTKEDSKNKVTKNLVAKILEVYSHEDSRFRTDPRLLHAWDLLGRTSIFLKYDAVMQNVDGLGYFKTSPEFFRLWAAYLAEKKDRTNFEKLHVRVALQFPQNKSLLDVFSGYAKQFGPKVVNQDEDITENVFDKLGSTPIYRAPPPPPSLAALNEDSEQTNSCQSESDKPISSPVESQKSTSSRNSSLRNADTSSSSVNVVSDNPFGNVGGFSKPQMASKNVFDSDKIFDDPTISGLNKQQSESRASSTPTGGRNARNSVPTFEVSPTATFPLANKENEPFTFAPAVSVSDEIKTPPPKRSTVPLLSEAINRMSIAPVDEDDDLDATTHDLSAMPEVEIKSGVNPWSENERSKVLKIAPPMVEQHDFLATKVPSFSPKGRSTVELGGEKFKILNFFAQGGFARIYKTQAEDGKNYAIKLEMPSCPWEVYICKSLSVRLPQEMQPFAMSIRDAYIFSNASAIVYDYYPMKTLLDLSNSYKQEKTTMDGMLVAFVGIQIAEILNYVHQAKIIHADIKPDNFVIVEQMSPELPHLQYIKPFVKLIDWGRAIDMSFYPDQTFKGRAGTNGSDCHEMQEDRPWTYQIDYFGYVGTMHVLIFGMYMETFYHATRKVYAFTEQLKRRYPLCETWTKMFRDFLNIPSCDKLPSWEAVVTQLKQDLEDFATEDVCAWRRAIDKCNSILCQSVY